MQTIRRSWLEALTNILIGYLVNFTANLIVLPLFGFKITVRDNLENEDLRKELKNYTGCKIGEINR